MTELESTYIKSVFDRIQVALNKNISLEEKSELWDWCYSHSTQVEITIENLENMAKNNLTWGFFGGTVSVDNQDSVLKLATALGVFGVQNLEGGKNHTPVVNNHSLSCSEILDKIQDKIGFKIQLPKFIGGRDVLMTSYGVITDRHCHYLWVMKRIIELFPDRDTHIVEIGGGLGLLGYYLDACGYKDYTIIDLARTSACQTYFLARNLPHRKLILSGESENPFTIFDCENIKLLHSSDFANIEPNTFDLMVNMDGLTEMTVSEATKYMQSNCAPTLLSVNHEMNDYRVCEISEPNKKLVYRYPFWIRDGYVEELYQTKQ